MVQPASRRLVTEQAAMSTYAPLGVRTADMVFPAFVGHGGLGSLFPTDSLEGYRAAAAAPGVGGVEFNVTATGDGTLVCIHGPTIGTTTSTTPTALVGDQSAASVGVLEIDTTTQFPWYGTAGYKVRVPTFKHVLTELGHSTVKFPEVKSPMVDTAAAPEVAVAVARAIIDAGVASSTVLCSFHTADLALAAAEGVECLWHCGTNPVDPAALLASGIEWVGVSRETPDAQAKITTAKAGGLKVMIYTPNRATDYAGFTGYDVVASDDPQYLAGSAMRTTDPFEAQTWYPGMRGATFGSKGAFTRDASGSWWGHPEIDNNYRGSLMGWANFPDPSNYTIDLDVIIDATNGDVTRWPGIGFGFLTDKMFTNAASAGVDGYTLITRASGRFDVFRADEGVATQVGASLVTTAPTVGVTIMQVRIQVTPTQIIITRVDTGSTTTLNDATYRGEYMHLGRLGASARFKNIRIT